jgi:hypothetical protein
MLPEARCFVIKNPRQALGFPKNSILRMGCAKQTLIVLSLTRMTVFSL